MKLALWLCVAALIGMGVPRVSAQTPIDPFLIINRGTGYPACLPDPPSNSTPTCFAGGTIVEHFNNGQFSFDFVYNNPNKPLTSLTLKITGVPEDTPFTCSSDIWDTCTITVLNPEGDGYKKSWKDGKDDNEEELTTVKFVLTGDSDDFLPPFNPQDPQASSFGVDEVVPEPGTWVFFATGIFAFALIGFARKRSGATLLT